MLKPTADQRLVSASQPLPRRVPRSLGLEMFVLIVEDNQNVAETLCQAFTSDNHESLAVPSAQVGLDLLRSRPVDLVLLDINLPGGLSGFAACEAFKSLRPEVPVILMTGAFTSDADARLAEHVGASGFLRKPFGISELVKAVQRALATAQIKPPAFLVFHCQVCNADSRVRQEVGETRRIRCPNCGTTSVVKMDELRPATEFRTPIIPPTLRRRILVVDNAEHFRLYLLDLLTEAGHYVVTARDGQEAYRLAEEWAPDLVITDILLPGIDGISLCQQIKTHARLKRTAVIIITGLKNEEYRVHGRRAGVDFFLSKPIRAEELFEKLQTLLAHSPR